MSHAYDPDDVPRSPGLEPSKPNYGVEEPPPPFWKSSAEKGTSSDSSHRNWHEAIEHEMSNPLKREPTPEDKDDLAALAQNAAQNALRLLPETIPKDNPTRHDPVRNGYSVQEPQVEHIPPQLPPPQPSRGAARREPLSLKQLASNQDSLPALHQPPPVFHRSPENQNTLPPLQSALPELSNPRNDCRLNGVTPHPFHPPGGPSPRPDLPREHHFPGPYQAPLSPYSHFSPASSQNISTVPSPVSQARPSHKSTIPYVTTPYEAPPQTTKSPATSYPTPTEPPTVGVYERPYGDATTPLNGPVTGSFKCDYPGCTAPTFQTQYLLNSHANVHSQDRPHYCPIEGCPRARGGKGFKRKNEMIRHGLVHNSPGYVCPFCPGQQHRYPRPDNLQRHVRVHHVDRDGNDPELRRVLSQRPEGSTRGRRRKISS